MGDRVTFHRLAKGPLREGPVTTSPRSRSMENVADAKLEKTSLSAGGFLRVPYGFGIGLWLHTRQAIIKISNKKSTILPTLQTFPQHTSNAHYFVIFDFLYKSFIHSLHFVINIIQHLVPHAHAALNDSNIQSYGFVLLLH